MSSEVSGPLQLTHLPFRNCGQAILSFFSLSQCTYINCAPQFFPRERMQRGKRRKRRVCKSAPTTDRPLHTPRPVAGCIAEGPFSLPSLLFSQNNGTCPPPCSRLQKVWLCAGGKGGRGSDACKNSLLFVSVYVRERFKSPLLFHAIILCGKLLCSDALHRRS